MRFTAIADVRMPALFRGVTPGQQHHDGRRYLPILHFIPQLAMQVPTPMQTLAVVDRHHLVDPQLVGQYGMVQLVLLLAPFALQTLPYQQGFSDVGSPAHVPHVYGQVTHVATWEIPETPLPYQSLYCEFVLDVGGGTVGVRTHVSATRLADRIGTPMLAPGDWVMIPRPRIDVLGFVRQTATPPA